MHEPVAITDGIFWIGVDDRETALFEALWPLPEGVSYNAYMIKDEKIALIDTVKRGFLDNYMDKVSAISIFLSLINCFSAFFKIKKFKLSVISFRILSGRL